MSKDEKSLLLYFESRCVDNRGSVDGRKMNEIDFEIANRWDKIGFIQFGRVDSKIMLEYIENQRPISHWVELSDEAWKLAHEERRARARRNKKDFT